MPRRLRTFKDRFAKPLMAGALLSSFFGASVASANPSGPNVRSGNVNINNINANTMHIDQLTQKAIIDWQKFGIGQGESVRFLQPNELSVILNRVVGQDPSKILGNLSANGNVFLINPNGILFGPGSMVNVGGLVASTLDISNEDFLSGNFKFTQDANKALASVVNQGTITVTDGGYAVLMAPLVSNEGMIVANLGQVNLISGESATLNFDGRNLISYDVGHMDSIEPGTVVVDRETVSGLLANVIRDSNLTEAGGMIENADGTVSLVGMGDTVLNNGTIQANGVDGQDAGKVVLDSGRLTVVGSDAVIQASGEGKGSSGGEIIALSHGTMKLAEGATLEARSADGGNGGYVDTSGYGRIILEEYADVGTDGTWLIDPEFLTIISGSGGVLDGLGTDPLDTTNQGGQTSSISEDFLEGITAGNVILQADNQITINALADGELSFTDGVDVTFQTGTGDLVFANRTDRVRVGGDGDLTLDIGRDIYLGVLENEGTGQINIGYGGNLYDGNGDANNIIGDFLTFDLANGDLSVIDELGAKTAPNQNSLNIAGTVGAGSDPLSITFNNVGTNDIDILSGGLGGRDLGLSGGDLSSGNFQTRPTDITFNGIGDVTVDGFQAENVRITSTGVIDGGGNTPNLTASSAVLSGTNIGSGTTLVANVGNLDVESTANAGIVDLDTGALTTDLTIRSNNSVVTVDGNTVTTANATLAGFPVANPPGVTTTFTTLSFSDPTVNFSFLESATRTIEIGGVTASTVFIDTPGSIIDLLAPGDEVRGDTITLSSGQRIGTFRFDDGTGTTTNVAAAPILVNNTAGTGGAVELSISTGGGPVNVAHAQNPLTNFIEFNSDDILTAAGEADLLNVEDSAGDSFSSLSFTRTVGNIVVGQIGAASPLSNVSLTALDGSILNSTVVFLPGDTNIFSQTLSLVAFNGSVGSSGDLIETSALSISAQGDNGVFIDNQQELEIFGFITDGNADSVISATNGALSYDSGTRTLTTTFGITDSNGDQAVNGVLDGYDVALNVQILDDGVAGDDSINIGNISIDGNSAMNDGTAGRAVVNIVTDNGDINGPGVLTVGDDTDVNLISSGDVGNPGAQLSIDSTDDSPGELLVDAGGDIGIDLQDDFDVVTLLHDDGNVLVNGGIITVDSAGLDITGTANVSTIRYENRTAGFDIGERLVGGGILTNGSDVVLVANGDMGSAPDGDDNIEISSGDTVQVFTTGSFSADATSAGLTSSLDLVAVGGDATVRNNNGLRLNTVTPGTVVGSLFVDNDSQLELGDLTVGGAATFTNSADVDDDGDGTTDLVAASLTVVSDAAGTSFDLETDVGSITIDDDDMGAGGATINIINADGLDFLTVNSDLTRFDVETANNGGDIVYNNAFPKLTTGTAGMDVGAFTLTEADLSGVSMGTVTLDHVRETDVDISTSAGAIIGGRLTTEGDATFDGRDLVDISTNVAKTLDITSQTGDITFDDTRTDGPENLIVNTVNGQTVMGSWDGGDSDMSFDELTDRLLIRDLDTANTNVTFETGTGDIAVDFAGVGDCAAGDLNDLTLIASSSSGGRILDEGDPGTTSAVTAGVNVTNPDLDLQANNLTLLATGDIGEPTGTGNGPLEIEICDTVTARSDDGGVFLAEQSTIEHLIIDVFDNDYTISFEEFATGATVTTQYLSGPASGVVDGPGTGGANTLGVTNSGGGSTMQGTDFTFIERDTQTVELITSISNVGGGDPGTDDEFIRIISGGSIISSDITNVLSTDNVDLISNGAGGTIGTELNPIFLTVDDICVDVRGLNSNAYVVNSQQIGNLFLAYNQDGSGAGDVNVVWQDNAGNDVGVKITDQLLSTGVNFTDDGGTTHNTANVDEANVVISNGNFDLDGTFTRNGVGNGDSFERIENSYAAGTGGDILVGQYRAFDTDSLQNAAMESLAPRLELQARGSQSGIFYDSGNIDLTGGAAVPAADSTNPTLVLVAEGTDIGSIADPLQIVSTQDDTVTVNAYTANVNAAEADPRDPTLAGEDDEGLISLSAIDNDALNEVGAIEYNEIYAGTDLELIAPFHELDQFSPGGAANFTPGQRAGSAALVGDGEICANDVIAGTSADESMGTNDGRGDVEIRSEGAGDILIGRVEAGGSTVRVVQTADGNVLEKAGTENDGNVFARNFEADLDGTGDIGTKGVNKPENALDIVVLESSLDVDDGNVYLRNVGNIIYNDVNVERTGTDGEVYLVSEGITVAGNVEVGNTTDVDLLIETRPGSDLLVGNVQTIGNTTTLRSTGNIRGDANMLNLTPDPMNDVPFAEQGRIQADNVLLLANGNIGSSAVPLELVASDPMGGTVVVSADTSGTSGGGGSPFTPVTGTDLNDGSVFLSAGDLTDVEIGTVVDQICNFSGTGIANAIDVCIDVTDGTLEVDESVNATGNVQLQASGDITLGDTTTTDFTQTTNDGTDIDVTRDDGRINAGGNTGIESTGGSIIDGNDTADNIRTGNAVVLRADGSVGAASFDGNSANDDAIEVRAARLAGLADNGSFNVDDQSGDLRIINGGGAFLKSGTTTDGVVADGDICIEADRDIYLEAAVTSDNEGVALNARTRDIRFQNNGIVTAQDIVSLEAGRNVRDFNDAALDIDVQGTGQLVIDADGGVGSAQDGTSNLLIETDAGLLAVRAGTGDVNIDNDSNLIINQTATIKDGETVTGVSAGREICIDNTGTLNINEDVVSGTVSGLEADIELLATDTITIGNDNTVPSGDLDADQIIATDPGASVSIDSTNGDIVDNNGLGNAAVVAHGSEVGLRAANGTVGTVDFSASPNSGQVFEVDTSELAVESGNDVNVVDLDTNGLGAPDGLVIGSVNRAKVSGVVSGITAANDICIDVVNGNLIVDEDIENAATAVDGSGVALRTQDADNATDDDTDGDIVLRSGASVVNNADNDAVLPQQAITSLEAAGQIRQIGAGSSVEGANVALESEDGIGHTNDDVSVVADTFAAVSSNAGDINLVLTERTADADVTVGVVNTLKGENTVTGARAAADVCLDVVNGDNLLVIEDVVSGTAAGGTGNIAIRGTGDVLIGQTGLDAGQVRTTDTGQTISIETTGDILDENNTDFAAIEALGGTVVLQSDNGSIGQAAFVNGGAATGTKLEIDALNVAAQADIDGSGVVGVDGGDVNIADVDTNADGLNIVSFTTGKDSDSIVGVQAFNEICIDVVNGDLNVDETIVSRNSSVALRTQDVDFATDPNAGINLNGFDVVANQNGGTSNDPGGARISLESSGDILDTDGDDGELIADDVVMVAEDGIGDTTQAIEINATNLAARNSLSGDINIQDVGGGVNVVEDLFTIKDGLEVDGLTTPGDICLDVVGDLGVQADMIAGGDVAIESTANITLGDALNLGMGSDQTGVIVAGDGLDVNVATTTTVSIEAGGNVIDGNGEDTVDNSGNGIADGVNIVANQTAGDGSAATRTGDLVVTTDGSFGDADFTDPSMPMGDAIEAEIGRVAADSGGDFNLEDVSGSLEIAEGLNTLKTPETDPIDGITAGEDICIDVSDTTNVANLFVSASVTADDADPGAINNIALAADDNVVLGDTVGDFGIVTAGDATTGNFNNTNGAQPNGVVSVEARNGAVLDGQQDDANVSRTANIINRGGDTVLIGMLGVGDNAGPDQSPAVNPDPIPGVPVGDVADQIEIDSTRFAAEATMGSVNVFDLDTDMDGLDIEDLNNLKDGRLIAGITSGLDVCIEVVNQDIVVDENIIAARNVALKTNQNVILGDTGGPDRGVIVAGAGKDLIIGNTDDVVGNVSIEAGGNITDGNGDSRVDLDGDGFADGANIIATGDIASGGVTTGGFVALQAGGGIGSDGVNPDDAIEIDALSVAANADAGDVNITEQDIVTRDGLSVGRHTTLKDSVEIIGVTASDDVCIDVEDGDLRINENIEATDGNVALRTQQLEDNSGTGEIRFGDNTATGGDTDVETVTAGDGGIISVEAAGQALDDNGTGNAALITGTGGSVVFNAESVTDVTTTGSFEVRTDLLAAQAIGVDTDMNGTLDQGGNVLVNDLDGNLTIGEVGLLKGVGTIVGVRATEDICVEATDTDGDLFVNEDVVAGDDAALAANRDITLGESGGTSVGVIIAGAGDDTDINALTDNEEGAVSIEAGRNVLDGNGATGNVIASGEEGVGGGDVVITAGGGIGSDEIGDNKDAIEIDTLNLAASAGTDTDMNGSLDSGGDINIREVDAFSQDGLTVTSLTTQKGGTLVNGLTAAADICVELDEGDLRVNDDVLSEAGNIAIITNDSDDAVNGIGDVIIGDGTGIDELTARADGALVSIEANGRVLDNNGTDNAAVVTSGADGSLVVRAEGLTNFAETGAFEVETDVLAALAVGADTDSNGSLDRAGSILVDDLSGNLVVGELTTLKGTLPTTGLRAVEDICVEVTGTDGDLFVNEDVIAGDDAALAADRDITLGESGGTSVGVIIAGAGEDTDINALTDNEEGAVSIEAGRNVLDGNGATRNIIASGEEGVGGGDVVITAGGGIGSDENGDNEDAIEIDTLNLAASAGTDTDMNGSLDSGGDINIREVDAFSQDGLTVTSLTTQKGGTLVNGLTAAADICVELDEGDLRINEDVLSEAGNIAIITNDSDDAVNGIGDVIIGDGTGVDELTARADGAQVSIEANGRVLDNNGTDNAAVVTSGDDGSLVVRAEGLTDFTETGAFEVETDELAALAVGADTDSNGSLDRAGSILVDDLSGNLVVGELTTLKGDTLTTGLRAVEDICVEVTGTDGDLFINEDVVAGDDAALAANRDITLGESGGTSVGVIIAGAGEDTDINALTDNEEGAVSIEAGRNVLDGNGTTGNVIASGVAGVGGGDVVITAGGGIGSDEIGDNKDAIEIDTLNLAASAGTDTDMNGSLDSGGDINIREVDAFSQDGLTVTSLTTQKGGTLVNGLTAAADICVELDEGDLRINEDVLSEAGNIAIITNDSDDAVNGIGDVIIGDGTGVDELTARADGAQVSIEANGRVLDNNGTDNAAVVTSGDDGSLVVRAEGLTDFTETGAFEVETDELAALAVGADTDSNGSLDRAGSILVDDLSGNLVVGELTTLKGDTLTTGLRAVEDICVEVTGTDGDLFINEDVVAGDDAALAANRDITLGESGGTSVGVIIAGAGEDTDINALTDNEEGAVSIEAGRNVLDGNGTTGNVIASGVAGVGGGDVVITAGGGIGSDEIGDNKDAIEIDTLNFAADAGTGDVNITELDIFSRDGLTISSLVTQKNNVDVIGVTAGDDICIDVEDGALDINENLTANNDVDLRTQDRNADNDGDINVNDTVVTATNGNITIDSSDDVVDNNGLGNAALVAGASIVLDVGDELRSTEPAPDDEFEIEAAGFAARVTNGGVDLADLSGDLEIVEGVTGKDGDTIDGVTAPGDVCIDVRDGSLDIGQQITSADNNVALQATGDITITGADDVTADANGGAGTVSVEAGDEILDTSDGSFVGQDVVLESVNGIGTDEAVTIDATNLAAAGGNGRANITDIDGGVTIAALDTLKGGDTITGVTAAEDVCLQVVGGDLVIDEVVTAGTVAAIQADGSIASNALVSGTNKVSVQSGGDIVDGLGDSENFVGSQVVLSADGDIGSKADAIDIDSDQVAAQSLNGEINLNETNGDMNVATIDLEKNGGTVSGIDAATDACLTVDGGTLNYQGQTLRAGNELAVRARDTITTGGTMISGNRISVEVTNGSILDNDDSVDFETRDLVLKAQGSVGSEQNVIETNVDRVAAQAVTGDVYLFEQNGLRITSLELAKGGGLINGIDAGNDVDITVDQGDLEVELVTAGNDVTLTANQGDIKDSNDGDLNISAGGDVELNAPLGCVEDLEIEADGTITFNDTKIRNFQPDPLILPPGVFAQDNVWLGESSFYLDVLYGYLVPEELDLIMDELEAYDFWNDKDFLLEKHPDGEKDEEEVVE